jgi:carboxypeptidase Taq
MSNYAELIRRSREAALLGSCAAVLGWDERVYMPRGGAGLRGDQMGLLARLTHEMVTDPRVGELLAAAEAEALSPDEAVNVRELRRARDRAVKLPKSLVEELARTTTRAQGEWQEARAASDFARFRPWLEKVVALKRQEAEAVGFTGHPYDALLDEYEPGATTAEITRVFAGLSAALVPLVGEILARQPATDGSVLRRDYDVARQREFGTSAARAIGFDFEAGRLDTTTHPFCSGVGPGDCRITTRYNPRNFAESFFGTLHETGHGLYEQGLPAEHFGTPLGTAASLGVHESQSRLWENQVGRGRPFWEHFFPKARSAFPALAEVSPDTFLAAVNRVERSYIRVEADEATYNLHIILRFELEQALLTGDLTAADVPAAWDAKFKAMFGLEVPDAARGCLQDIHWSMGGIGYFPTYTLGNLLAAQFMDSARSQLGGLDDDFRRGEFGRLLGWLRENIYRHGQRYRSGELCERVTGRPLSHAAFIDYLRGKFISPAGVGN